MRHWWPKLIVGLVMIILLIVMGVFLYRTILGLLGAISSGGDEIPGDGAYVEEEIWTQPPYFADESDYDNVSAVREYAEPSSVPTSEP